MSLPKIAIVTTYMDRRPAKGTAICIRKLVEGLRSYREEFDITLIHEQAIPEDPLYQEFREIIIPRLRLPRYVRFFSELWFYLTTAERFDILYSPYSRLYPTFWLAPARKFMYLIGDGGPESSGFNELKVKGAVPWWIRWFFWRVSAFITVSQFGKKGVIDRYHLPPEKVFVAYNGVGSAFVVKDDVAEVRRELQTKYGISFPCLLDVSRFDPHKNILRVLEVYKTLIETDGIPHTLVFVGGRHIPDYSFQVEQAIQRLGLAQRVIITPFIPDEDMPKMYRASDLLLFPSLYEGFGLPIVEAMASGIPVVASNVGSLPEVVGDAGILVDPYSVDAMVQGVRRMLGDAALRQELVTKGMRRAAAFSWEQGVEMIVHVFRLLLKTS